MRSIHPRYTLSLMAAIPQDTNHSNGGRLRKLLFFCTQFIQSIAITLVTFATSAHTLQVTIYRTHLDVANYVGADQPFPSTLRRVGDLSLAYLYIAVPWITCLHHAYAWRVPSSAGYSVARWVEYSITAALMTVTLACLCGVTTLASLCALIGSNIILQGGAGATCEYLCSCARRYPETENHLRRQAQLLFAVACGGFAVLFLGSVGASFVAHAADAPAFVVWLFWVIALLYAGFPYVMYRYLWTNVEFGQVDFWYDVLSLTSKAALDWIIVAGFVGWSAGD